MKLRSPSTGFRVQVLGLVFTLIASDCCKDGCLFPRVHCAIIPESFRKDGSQTMLGTSWKSRYCLAERVKTTECDTVATR